MFLFWWSNQLAVFVLQLVAVNTMTMFPKLTTSFYFSVVETGSRLCLFAKLFRQFSFKGNNTFKLLLMTLFVRQ